MSQTTYWYTRLACMHIWTNYQWNLQTTIALKSGYHLDRPTSIAAGLDLFQSEAPTNRLRHTYLAIETLEPRSLHERRAAC